MQQHRGDTQIVHEEQILEAIDQLRRRKARPDADRICNYLLRKFSVDARDTIADLHRLIEAEKVIQVDYKGNTSYRNASKWSRLQLYKNRPEGFVKEKLNSSMVAGAVAELVVEEPDYLDQGVPAYRLVEQLLDGISNPTSRKMVEDFLSKEVANGNITKLSNGNYSLVATSDITNSTSNQQQSQEHSQNGNSNQKHERYGKNYRRRCSSENGDSGKESLSTSMRDNNSGESYTFNESHNSTMDDSRSNTPRLSRHASPRPDNPKREQCHEVALAVKEPDSPEESITKDDSVSRDNSMSSHADLPKKDSNLKKSSKSERKQRLQVRADDSMDIEIKIEEFDHLDKSDRTKRQKETDLSHDFGEEREDEDTGRSSTNPSPTPSNTTVGAFRSARRKRAKKVFDPSDNNVVKRKRGRQPGTSHKPPVQPLLQEPQDIPPKPIIKESPSRHCSLCSKEKQETLVACRDCTVRAHPTCIYNSEDSLQRTGGSWQCERCKSCAVCCETSDIGPLITCCNCDEAYHHECHVPRITATKSYSKWHCSNCIQKQPTQSFKSHTQNNSSSTNSNNTRPETPINPTTLPPVLSPQVSPTRDSLDHTDEDSTARDGIDPNIPDASDWTSEQVYQYFARLFPKEAEIFRVQDIDGHSLLLLKRSDVLIGLDLLLGPALKIYRHVLKLQMRRDETRFYWL